MYERALDLLRHPQYGPVLREMAMESHQENARPFQQ
jgi:hypothetical protein